MLLKATKPLPRVVRPIVTTNPDGIPPDDKVGAAVVLSNESVKESLSWPGIPHRPWKDRKEDPLCRKIVLHQYLVATQTHFGWNVIQFGLPHQRMDQETIHQFQGTFLNVLMGSMDRISSLEANHCAPAAMPEDGPGFRRVELVVVKAGRERRSSGEPDIAA